MSFLSIFDNFNITILQKTFFSWKKKAPAGKFTHGKIFVGIFIRKKAPAGKFTHNKIFVGIFLEKKAPAGKFTHGKIFFDIFSVHIFLVHIFLAGAQWSLATAQWSLATAQRSLATAQRSLLRAQESKNTRKKSDYACYGSWWVQIGSRSRRWDLYRLIVWI